MIGDDQAMGRPDRKSGAGARADSQPVGQNQPLPAMLTLPGSPGEPISKPARRSADGPTDASGNPGQPRS